MERTVVILSGGLDSATVLAIARAEGYSVFALTFDYGQRHSIELESARRVAMAQGVERHLVMSIDLRQFGGSALTADIDVPHDRDIDPSDIPVTYVPARNLVFLSLATAWAETLEARHLHMGVNALDYSGYPDCRPDFMKAFETVARLGTRAGREGAGVSIHAPLIEMNKADIIRRGLELGVDYSITHSCYDPVQGLACGTCDSCALRMKGFADAGQVDPIRYWSRH